jgi:hypothetical protein
MTARARRWWHGVEAEADDPDGVRDPWADHPLLAEVLTAAQQAVLAGLDDQPDGPRLDGTPDEAGLDQPVVPRFRPGPAPGNGTGNAPGDPAGTRPYRRRGWTEPEQEQEG